MAPGSARNWIAVNAVQQVSLNKKMTTLLLRNSILRAAGIAGLPPALVLLLST
jgi:hypothetical protein